MSRPKPTITDAQKQRIAQYSQAEANDERRQRRIDALSADLNRTRAGIGAWVGTVERTAEMISKIAAVPVLLLTAGYLSMLLYGLWSGDLPSAAKYAKEHVYRAIDPKAFWTAAAFHGVFAALFCGLSFRLIRGTGWFRSRKD